MLLGFRLTLLGSVFAPVSHSSAVIEGSQSTLVGGNKSSWKNSLCSK